MITFAELKAQWPQAAALIKSGQIPEPRMAEIARDHPEFWNTVMGGRDDK